MQIRLSKIFPLIIIVNFIVDFIFYLQEENSVLALFRIVLNIGFVGLVILKNKKSSKNLFTPLFITIIYSSFLLFFSSEIYSSVIEFSKYATTLLFLPVAYYLINSKERGQTKYKKNQKNYPLTDNSPLPSSRLFGIRGFNIRFLETGLK